MRPHVRGARAALLALSVLGAGCASSAVAEPAATPSESAARRQLDAYNAKDIEAFLAVYTDDVRVFDHPNRLLYEGLPAMRARYTERFADPLLHARVDKRIVMGNTVVDYERVLRTFPEGPGVGEVVAIYECVGDKISKVWFIRGGRFIGARLDER